MTMLLVHAAATLFMTGVIWYVQIVHYPLFAAVAGEGFNVYEAGHSRLTTLVIALPMLVEAVTAGTLVVSPPEGIGRAVPLAGAVLVGVVWWSTFALQVPQHNLLRGGFDRTAHRRLVATNWVRTLGWTARAGIALWMLARVAA